MKLFWTILFMLTFTVLKAQQSVQVKLEINKDLSILTDVTATPDSIPNGRYYIIYKNKTLVKGRTKNGEMDGIWTTYFPNGQQKMKARYVNGKPHGEWTVWGINGDVQSKIHYNHGTRVGHWQGYYYNHSKAIDIVYNPNGKPDQCIQYYTDEIIALNHEYSYTKDKSEESLSYYFKNYALFHYESSVNGKLNGLYAVYHNNGMVWESFRYANGHLNTIIESHSRGGMPRKNDQFRDGNGVINKYYANGNLFSKTSYKNGLKNDTVFIYSTTGKNTDRGIYKNGKPVGKWGEITFQSNPDFSYKIHGTSPAPKEREEGMLLHGFRHGTWKSYDNYGEILGEITYSYGFINGTVKDYQSNKVMKEFNYSNDNRNGKSTYYSTFGTINSQEEYISESVLDTNWYKPVDQDWITIENQETKANQIHLWFYPSLPGMELIETIKDPQFKMERMFGKSRRNFGYTYWPELIPATIEGGLLAEKEYIRKHLWIPNNLPKKKIKGTVLLRYKIDEIGLISEVTILKTIGFGLDEAAMSLIKSFPPQNPATYNGIPIPSYVVREIDFNL